MKSDIKTYLVSFGNSDVYRYDYTPTTGFDGKHNSLPFEEIEKELTDYLKAKYPSVDSVAYFTSPKVTEVAPENVEKIERYHLLDRPAIEDIKKVLSRDISNFLDQQRMDLDAPFSDIKPISEPEDETKRNAL